MTILYVQKCCTHLELEHLYPRLPVAALAGDGGDVGPVEQVHNIHQRQGLHRAVGAVKTRIATPATCTKQPTTHHQRHPADLEGVRRDGAGEQLEPGLVGQRLCGGGGGDLQTVQTVL